ncbi:MAG: sigma-54-dependent transcriptional regulator [bacterium]
MNNEKESFFNPDTVNPKSISILVVDDDDLVRQMLVDLLLSRGYETHAAPRGDAALQLIHRLAVDIALIDYQLPDTDGIALMLRLRELVPSVLCLLITGYGTIERAVEAMHAGAWDFIPKPVTPGMLLEKIGRIESYCLLRREHDVRRKVLYKDFLFSGVIGASPIMRPVYEDILRAAQSTLPVLIEGETGSGKEFIAEAIHLNSKRKPRPYVVMDCTATPHSLIESALFGSTKGAFTGAVDQKGLLQAADGGTLVLDEIGEIALDIQPKLLRCLETKRFRPVGSTKELTSDFRIICCTNRDLAAETKKGKFRADLFYRISAMHIAAPALRERQADIPILARHFLQSITQENEREEMDFTPESLQILTAQDWPGNIRQLKFVIESAFFQTRGRWIAPEHLQLDGQSPGAPTVIFESLPEAGLQQDFKTFRESAILQAERRYIKSLMERHHGDVRQAAKQAGLTREALYRVMARCGLSPGQFRGKNQADALE